MKAGALAKLGGLLAVMPKGSMTSARPGDGDRTGVCPGCGEECLVEFDPARSRFVCQVCSREWPTPVPKPIPPAVRAQLVEALAEALVAGWRRRHAPGQVAA